MYNPLKALRAVIKKVPFVKYALGLVGIAAAAAMIKTYQLDDFEIPVKMFGIMFLGMVLLFVFSVLSSRQEKPIKVAGYILVYAVVFSLVAFAVLLISSAFFQEPRPIAELLSGTTIKTEEEESSRENLDPICSPSVLSNKIKEEFPHYANADYTELIIDIDGDGNLDIIEAGLNDVYVHFGKSDCEYSKNQEIVRTKYSENKKLYDNYLASFGHGNTDGIMDIIYTANDGSRIFAHLGSKDGKFSDIENREQIK